VTRPADDRPPRGPWQGYFQVACCGRRRARLPGGIIICSRCDFDHDHATVIFNEGRVRDLPSDTWYIYPKDLQ